MMKIEIITVYQELFTIEAVSFARKNKDSHFSILAVGGHPIC